MCICVSFCRHRSIHVWVPLYVYLYVCFYVYTSAKSKGAQTRRATKVKGRKVDESKELKGVKSQLVSRVDGRLDSKEEQIRRVTKVEGIT